jgi:biotin carboxyl carrier protein
MITTDDLDDILHLMLSGGLRSLEVSEGRARVRMKLDGTEAATATSRSEEIVSSKAVGSFLRAHPLDPDTALRPGDAVAQNDHVGYLRNDAVLLAIRAHRPGKVTEIHAEAGQLLGYGAPVLTLLSEG